MSKNNRPPKAPIDENGSDNEAFDQNRHAREVSSAPAEESGTDKINRTKFKSLTTYKAVDYFDTATQNIVQSSYYSTLSPKPSDLRTQAEELIALRSKAQSQRSTANSVELKEKVDAMKGAWNDVAKYVEVNYPGKDAIAHVALLKFNLKPERNGGVPSQVENVRFLRNDVPGEVTIGYDLIKGYRGKLYYVLFVSTDGGKTFRECGFASNGKGINFQTEFKQEYQFYVAARNADKVTGPRSKTISCVGQ